MKTKFAPFARIFTPVLLVMLMLILVMACRKKNDDPTPTPTPTPPSPPENPNAFAPRNLHLMTDYELSAGMRFPGYSNRIMHKGMIGEDVPDVINPLKELGTTLWDIHDYETTQNDFAQVENELNNISTQISQLANEVNSYGNEILGQIDLMTTLLEASNIQQYKVDIQNYWYFNPGPWSNYMAFQQAAAAYKRNPTNPDTINLMKAAQANVSTWATQATADDLWSDISNLQGQINLSGNTGILSQFVQTLSQHAQGSYPDSAMAMKYYLMLEGYFLTLLNIQGYAETMIINIDNVLDTTGNTAKNDFKNKYAVKITPEVDAFLYAVDYLITNISDYRTSSHFQNDMEYKNSGIAPFNVFLHATARAQFVANMIYEGLGLEYPKMCGYVLTPYNYTNGNSPIVNSFSLTFNNGGQVANMSATANTYQSQIPYPFWEAQDGSNAYVGADNNWNVYRFGTLGQTDPVTWNTGEIQVTVADNGNKYFPWAHYAPIQGNVKTMFYNPTNPDLPPTPSAQGSNTMQFGFFSLNWQWGHLFLSDLTRQGWQHSNSFKFNLFNPDLNPTNSLPSTPGVGTSDWQNDFHNQGLTGVVVNYNNIGGCMEMYGTTIETQYYYLAFDFIYQNAIQAHSDPANLINADLQAWACYDAKYSNGSTSDNNDLWVSIGTNIFSFGPEYSNWNICKNDHYHNQQNQWMGNMGILTGNNRNVTMQPSIQWITQSFQMPAAPINVQLNFGFQMVYTGFFLVE